MEALPLFDKPSSVWQYPAQSQRTTAALRQPTGTVQPRYKRQASHTQEQDTAAAAPLERLKAAPTTTMCRKMCGEGVEGGTAQHNLGGVTVVRTSQPCRTLQ